MGTDFDYGWFNQTSNPPSETPDYRCLGEVVCKLCGKYHGCCSEVNEKKETKGMNLGVYLKGQGGPGEFNPFIQAKDVSPKGTVLKVIGAREVNSPPRKAGKGKKASSGFQGLMVDLKNGTKKYCLPLRFDRPIDLSNAVAQMGSEDTDDWMGKNLKLVSVKGKQGGTFVNVARPKK